MTRFRKILIWTLLLLLCLWLGCQPAKVVETPAPTPEPTATPTPTPTPTPAAVISITLNHSDVTLAANEKLTLRATVSPSDWGGTVTWTADSSLVTISEDGVVTNVNTGSSKKAVTVTATAGDKTATCILRCNGGSDGPSVSADPTPTPGGGTPVTLNKSDFTIRPQDPSTVQLRASGGDGSYTWTSSNTSVATVSDDGKVTKVGEGMCTITCTSGGSSAKCIVRVS